MSKTTSKLYKGFHDEDEYRSYEHLIKKHNKFLLFVIISDWIFIGIAFYFIFFIL